MSKKNKTVTAAKPKVVPTKPKEPLVVLATSSKQGKIIRSK